MTTLTAGENWRPIPSTGGTYEASTQGRIRRASSRLVKKQSAQRDSGRLQVSIWVGGVGTIKRVHVLVAEAFYGPRPEDMEIRHMNGDQLDNRAENLRYGTHSENMYDQVRHGTHFQARKTTCKKGHPFNAENTYVSPNTGQRVCRTCSAAAKRAYKARRRTNA